MKFIGFFPLLFLLHFGPGVSGQPFNLPVDLGYPLNHFRDMIVDNDTIIGYGLGFSNDSIPQQGLLLSKFDSSGNHLFSRMILDPQGEPLFIDYHWGKIAKTRDGGYVMTAAPTHGDAAWLLKVGHDFEVEFIKEYLDTVNRSHYRYNAPIELSDGYLLSGGIQRPNYRNNPFARRVDQQGNTVWFKYYGDYDIEDLANSMAKVNDTLFVLCGTTDVEGPNSARVTIRFINGQGEVVRFWQSEPNPEMGYNRNVLSTAGGSLITFGLYLVEVIGGTSIVQPTLAKLDSNFQVEWLRHFGLEARLGADVIFWDIERLSGGNYIGAGESFVKSSNAPTRRVGWLHKFSPQGDSIWENLVDAPFPLLDVNRGTLAGVGELSSGSIVAAGETIEFNQRYIWLVKVTPDGCLDTLCSMVTAVEAAVAPAGEAPFSLYPNPTAGPLTLAWPGAPAGRETHIRLFDAAGREVWRQQRRVERRMELNLDGLPDGLYFLQVQTEAESWVKKVVVRE
ncbi:MAG: T9SS type A sorting domain-containing protein [Phaeodactylibacter sp.]|nr:T9SS type A sorting domain-containing protein [Phaeodactylibacter sp.]MCB9295877.1 T9SS type A sorting domain-containing protein [Lewinellaceae bacterium]